MDIKKILVIMMLALAANMSFGEFDEYGNVPLVQAVFPVEVLNERISVIEAIGLAGDLSIYGQRETVLLIRELNGSKKFITLDLTNKKIFDSPYYFLKQNDVIYITPNKTKVNASKVGPNTGVILSSISVLIAVIALII